VRLENSFEVPATPEAAWQLLNAVERVIPCMPGAELTEVVDEQHWKATMHVKLGPIALAFATDVERATVDESARSVQLNARARELRGRGGAQATVVSTLTPSDAGTSVTIVTDLTMSGAVAQYGRGVVQDVSQQLTQRFADCLAAELRTGDAPVADGPEPSEAPEPRGVKPVGGLSLAFGALWRSLLGLFRR
jgi:carbon monoxide dehydrogenase subunit G